MKAESSLQNPSKITRTKFLKQLKQGGKTNFKLNAELIAKTKLLLGLKGYYTNLSAGIENSLIISHYHSLWHVEQAFRIAKNDLQMRPIYHFKKEAIEAHILICFMALAVAKYLEIKTGHSLKANIKLLKSVTDARILNTLTGEEIVMRSEISAEFKEAMPKLDLSY